MASPVMRAVPTLLISAQDTLQEGIKGQMAQVEVCVKGATAVSLFILRLLRPWPCQSDAGGRGYAGSQPCWYPHTCPPSPASLAPTSPGGKSCLASLKAVPSGF